VWTALRINERDGVDGNRYHEVPHVSPQKQASGPHSNPRGSIRQGGAFVASARRGTVPNLALSTAEPLLLLLRMGKFVEPEIFFHWG